MTVYTTATEVANEIYARLQQITMANGYETDMGLQVFQGRVKVADEQVAPSCVSVIEGIDSVQQQAARGRMPIVKVEQRYGLVGYSVCDQSQPNVAAHKMLRDMKRALWHDGSTFGDRVLSVNYLSRDIGPRADGVGIVMALLEIGVEYAEQLGQP